MINFSTLQGLNIPEGAVTQVADASGRVIWSAGKTVNTVYLRPSADISTGHSLYPADSTSAYMLINEEVDDRASTYIYSSHSNTATTSVTSHFALYPKKTVKSDGVTGVKLVFNYTYAMSISSPILWYALTIAGETFAEHGLTTFSVNTPVERVLSTSELDAINSYITQNGTVPPITVNIRTHGKGSSSKSDGNFYIGQIYLELTGEFVV